MKPPFKLYPEEQHWWSFNDYGAVLDVMERLKPKRVLEFGPGSSTLALIEGGATHIDTCEDQQDWFDVYRERLAGKYPDIVSIHKYDWTDPIEIPSLTNQKYDLALVDGPHGTDKRPSAVIFALKHSDAVLTPTEDSGRAHASILRPTLTILATKHRRDLQFIESGPLSGGFALMTRKKKAAA